MQFRFKLSVTFVPKTMSIRSSVSTDHRLVTDRETDRQTDRHSTATHIELPICHNNDNDDVVVEDKEPFTLRADMRTSIA